MSDDVVRQTEAIPQNRSETGTESPTGRDARGRFVAGFTANPGGRPAECSEVKELARTHTSEAIERLVFWMRSDDPTASIAAVKELLSRGYGRPEQSISLPDGPLINVDLSKPIRAEDLESVWREMVRSPHLTDITLEPAALAAPPVEAVVEPIEPLADATDDFDPQPEPAASDSVVTSLSDRKALWEKLGR